MFKAGIPDWATICLHVARIASLEVIVLFTTPPHKLNVVQFTDKNARVNGEGECSVMILESERASPWCYLEALGCRIAISGSMKRDRRGGGGES